ncbi:hypothetical protein MBANPS3_007988 [Mucor bainieri]
MLKLDSKDEAFNIKMEELMKLALAEELQDMTDREDEDQPVDLVSDDNDETMTEEEMIQMIKKEPREKPLFVKDFVAHPTPIAVEDESESESLEMEPQTDPNHQHYLFQSSQTQSKEDTKDDDEANSSDRRSPPASVPDTTTTLEPKQPVQQVTNEPVYIDLEAMYEEMQVDTKPTSTTIKSVYYTSVECKACQITFNDNYGFRRHLNHVHPHDPEQALPQNRNTSQPEGSTTSTRRSLRFKSVSTPVPRPTPSNALQKKNPKCNVKFKRQFRSSLKLGHLKTIPLPEKYEKPVVDIQCRFCQKGGWKESEYRAHLLQRHSRELNPLSKQIADSNSERLKETEATTSSATTNSTASTTSNRSSNAAKNSPATADPDITMLDIPYDPIKDISENQRRTYQFFQNYMLDIN